MPSPVVVVFFSISISHFLPVYTTESSLFWHYEDGFTAGPSQWSNIDGGDLCGHEQQSPIEINPDDFMQFAGECNQPLIWTVSSESYQFSVSHTGRTITFRSAATNDVELVNSFKFVRLAEEEELDQENEQDEQHEQNQEHIVETSINNTQHMSYILDSFHFHWGTDSTSGSEHIYDGITTTLEVHFVHYSADYNSVEEALEAYETLSASSDPLSNDVHSLAVIGVLFEEVDESAEDYNLMADRILRSIAIDPVMTDLWQNGNGTVELEFAITNLIDVDDLEDHYYYYEGSLTTPPCTPVVRWHLAQNPVKIRASTMDLFRSEAHVYQVLSHDNNGHEYTIDLDQNHRPVQDNPSCVYVCAGDESQKWCPSSSVRVTTCILVHCVTFLVLCRVLFLVDL